VISLTELIERAELGMDDTTKLLESIAEAVNCDALSDFAKSHISYEDALEVAQSDDQFYDDFMPRSDEPIVDAIIAAPKDTVYSLVFSHPDTATAILNELLYYRDKGRI
jgi:hypothetical protein